MALLLQLWGGIFFLLNKIFFSRAERSEGARARRWRIASWSVYLIGLPAWVIIFIMERNWIAAALESSGAPAMVMGLLVAVRGTGRQPKWLDHLALVGIVVGLSASLYDFGGITTVNQLLEIGIVTGYLIGTYMLAKERPSGYLWFLLMNGSNAVLMYTQDYPWLVVQQIASLAFVLDAYVQNKRNNKG